MSKSKKAVSAAKNATKKAKSAAKKTSHKVKKQTRKVANSKNKRKKAKNTSHRMKPYSSLNHKRKTKKDAKSRKKAEYLATLPKSRWKRFAYRMQPKRLFAFLFSKEGMRFTAKFLGISFAILIVLMMGTFAFFRKDLPDPRAISSRLLNQSTKFYDRTGQHLLYEVYGDQNRTVVEFDQISDHAKHATVAVEDKDFYNHGGFSVSGILRAAVSNVFGSGDGTQGGSTITQQFIKNSLLTDERTYTRKIKELILAVELERLYSKDEILSFYLNEIPYGSQEYGIEAAAQSFFGKPALELNPAESAMLAALPQAPTYYSPYGVNTEELITRTHIVLGLMKEQGYLTDEEYNEALEVDVVASVTPIEKRSLYTNITAPHFVLETQQILEQEFGPSLVQTGGLKIITTLDKGLQNIAEKAIKQNMATVVNPLSGGGGGDNAAIVATDVETGQILALVGSRNFTHPKYGSYNAAMANRQPGSSFKPFGYSELFKSDRWGPDSYIYDTPTSFGDYNPKNFDFGYRGRMKVRQALGESRNIPAVKALYIAGVDNTIQLAKSMGNKSLGTADQYGLSLVLGAGEVKLAEHTNAYGTFARHGEYQPLAWVLKVENADGDALLEWEKTEGEQVLDEEIAYLMNDVLTDDAARSGTFGLGNPRLVVPGLTHAVKTGTTDRSVDGWMMGYTKYMAVGVWAGNHDNAPMDTITSWQTGPIFTQFLQQAHQKKKYEKNVPIFDEVPEGIKRIRIDSNTGYAADDDSKKTHSGLFPSWHVKQVPDRESAYTIDTVSGRLATECTPEGAREEVKGGGIWPELLPDDPWYPLWSRSTPYGASSGGQAPKKEDNVHKCSDDIADISVNVSSTGTTGLYELEAIVSEGTHDVETLKFRVNGQVVNAQDINGSGTYTYSYSSSSDGNKTVSAEVVDEALYENSNSTTFYMDEYNGGGGASVSILTPSNGSTVSPFSINFSWTSASGASGYQICTQKIPGGGDNCEISLDTDQTISLQSNKTYQAYVKIFQGFSEVGQSPVITFSTN